MTDDYDEALLSLRIQLEEVIFEHSHAIMRRIAELELEIAEVRGRIECYMEETK